MARKAIFLAAALVGCGSNGASSGPSRAPDASASNGPQTSEEAGVDATIGDAGNTEDASYDPFAAQPDESEGLTNVSPDLNALLENGALPTACSDYQAELDAGVTDRKAMLLCGKWMFFYDPFGTVGIPTALLQFFATNFPNELGLGFSKVGMVPDPSSTTNMPLGVAPTAPTNGTVPAAAFTCASCHFAQLPDGRYAVGAPNLRWDYATTILDLTLAPGIALGTSQASAHDPAAVSKVQPILDEVASNSTLKLSLMTTLLPLASLNLPAIPTAEEHDYATWQPGTMDFLIEPLPIDDQVHIVGKMIGLWGIPRPAEMTSTGMSSAMLAWSGDATDLYSFLHGFAQLGGAATVPTDAELTPLAEYIYSLRAPSNPSPPDPSLVATGAALFGSAGCATCHDGPRGSGKRTYSFTEVGTDPALAQWADPTQSGTACCGVTQPADGMSHGVKSPRLVGMWALERLLHNGSLQNLDQLLCVGGDDAGRPEDAGVVPEESVGHSFGCNLTSDEKQALIAFLLSH